MLGDLIGIINSILELIIDYIGLDEGIKKAIFSKGINIVVFIVIAIIIFSIYKFIKSQKKEEIPYDEINKIEKNNFDIFINLYNKFDYSNNFKNIINDTSFDDLFKSKIQEYIDGVEQVLSKIAKDKIIVSLRFFEQKTKDFKKAKLNIYVYSKNCDLKREALFEKEKGDDKDDKAKVVGENSEFLDLFSLSISSAYFYQADLKKYEKKLKRQKRDYNNQTDDYYNHYKGRMSFPIYGTIDGKKRNVGILCADTKNKKVFTSKQEVLYVYLMQKYTMQLFYLLCYYLKLQDEREKIKKQENKDAKKEKNTQNKNVNTTNKPKNIKRRAKKRKKKNRK